MKVFITSIAIVAVMGFSNCFADYSTGAFSKASCYYNGNLWAAVCCSQSQQNYPAQFRLPVGKSFWDANSTNRLQVQCGQKMTPKSDCVITNGIATVFMPSPAGGVIFAKCTGA